MVSPRPSPRARVRTSVSLSLPVCAPLSLAGGSAALRRPFQISAALKRLSVECDVAFVVTNHVTADFADDVTDNAVKPALGLAWRCDAVCVCGAAVDSRGARGTVLVGACVRSPEAARCVVVGVAVDRLLGSESDVEPFGMN